MTLADFIFLVASGVAAVMVWSKWAPWPSVLAIWVGFLIGWLLV